MSKASGERLSLGETAYRRLRDDVVSCRLIPGQRLTERTLAAEMGMGISPIREALTRLDHEGLVWTLPRKGYQVAPLTVKSVDDLFAVWQVVGPEIARLGVERATEAQLDEIAEHFRAIEDPQLRDDAETDEALRRIRISAQVFELLAAATGNDYLVAVYHRLAGDMSRIWAMVFEAELLEGSTFEPVGDWQDIVRRRDGARASEQARRFIEHSRTRVLEIMLRWPSVMASEVHPPGVEAR